MLALPAKPRLTSLRARFTIKTLHNRELCITASSGPQARTSQCPLWCVVGNFAKLGGMPGTADQMASSTSLLTSDMCLPN